MSNDRECPFCHTIAETRPDGAVAKICGSAEEALDCSWNESPKKAADELVLPPPLDFALKVMAAPYGGLARQ